MTRGLAVVGLGGNAISPPGGDLSIRAERAAVRRALAELAELAREGYRLLIVHGNGPQAGRLLDAQAAEGIEALDVVVAQTQGELGYLIAEALDAELANRASVAVVTRVLVDPADAAFEHPSKAVGAVLPAPPDDHPAVPTADGRGWRRAVPSPRPIAVLESAAIRRLLAIDHVVAGGGGGVPVHRRAGEAAPIAAVVDKDWVAALLAIELEAELLLSLTNVPAAFHGFGGASARALHDLGTGEARKLLADGVFAPGSMAPKIESAVEFVEAAGRRAVIATPAEVRAALAGSAGTTVRPAPIGDGA